MVNITYRISDSETAPLETTVKGSPLTNYEIDANFKALVDELNIKAPIDSPTFNGTVSFNTNGAVVMPYGTIEQRPTEPVYGMVRINTTIGNFEYFRDGNWTSIASGATGSKGDQVYYLNDKVVNYSYEIPSTKNAMSTGKIALNDDVTVTIPDGSRWVVL